MITITRGQANTVIVTLTEKVTIDSPHFLFEFRGDSDKEYQYCIAADVSAYTYRYNQFVITEKNSPNPLAGEIHLPNAGYYHCAIYQQASSTNLDPAHASGVVELDKCRVIAPSDETTTIYEPTTPQTNIVYTPQS